MQDKFPLCSLASRLTNRSSLWLKQSFSSYTISSRPPSREQAGRSCRLSALRSVRLAPSFLPKHQAPFHSDWQETKGAAEPLWPETNPKTHEEEGKQVGLLFRPTLASVAVWSAGSFIKSKTHFLCKQQFSLPVWLHSSDPVFLLFSFYKNFITSDSTATDFRYLCVQYCILTQAIS